MKQRGLFDFQLKEPATDQPTGWRPVRPRSLYHPIVMIEPQQDGQNSQLGMDINADGQHSETLRAAEQFGHMESTAPFALPDNGRGYLLVKAVQQQHGTRGGEPRQALSAFCCATTGCWRIFRWPIATPTTSAWCFTHGWIGLLTICFSARR